MPEKRKTCAARPNFTPARQGWKPRSAKAKPVGEFVPKLMRPAFEKFGFSAAAILTDWAAIAGPRLAAFTAPERLKWPRKDSGGGDGERPSGATLILRVAGARALEVEHLRPRLIERINAAFGYRAVKEIKLLQAPLANSKTEERMTLSPSQHKDDGLLNGLDDDALKNALSRIASGIEARRRCREATQV